MSTASRNRSRWTQRSAVVGVMALAHVALFLMLARVGPEAIQTPLPPIEVELVEPTPPEPDPPDPAPSEESGGGAPAAPSRVHVPPDPPRVIPEVIAPIEQAPEPDPIVVGVAPVAGPAPGQGLGGQGTGSGTGVGSGSGPGSGTRYQLVRGPTVGELRDAHPPAALRAGRSGRAAMSCIIGLNERLSDCEVISETPRGQGFGQAALAVAGAFQARPPVVEGRPQPGTRGVFAVVFGREDQIR